MSLKIITFRGLIFLALMFALWACKEDFSEACAVPIAGGNVLLSSDTKAFTQNYSNTTKIIFENADSEEIEFEVNYLDTVVASVGFQNCNLDEDESQPVLDTSQIIDIRLSNTVEFEKPFNIRVGVLFANEGNDLQSIFVSYDNYSASNPQGILFYYEVNEENPRVDLIDTLTVNGRTYQSVYQQNDVPSNPPPYEVKYTTSEGIVYIKNTTTLEEYNYKRKE